MKRFSKFAAVGVFATGLDFLVFSFALALDAAPALARGLGYLAGTSCSFFLNRKWVFRHSAGSWRLFRFLFIYLVSGSFAVVVQYVLGMSANKPNNYIVYIIATLVAAAINYAGLKLFVFYK